MDTDGGPTLPSYPGDCPSRPVLDVLASKWSLYVLGALHECGRPLRFTEVRRCIEGVTQKSLTQTLRNLERAGLVSRTAYPTIPPRVEYDLTDLGAQAERLSTAIAQWSVANAAQVRAAQDAYDRRPASPAAFVPGEPVTWSPPTVTVAALRAGPRTPV